MNGGQRKKRVEDLLVLGVGRYEVTHDQQRPCESE